MAKMFDGKLSSPCGDKLQYGGSVGMMTAAEKLSSPCGDKLQFSIVQSGGLRSNYRPLAGISCNSRTAPKRNSFPAFFKACSAITR